MQLLYIVGIVLVMIIRGTVSNGGWTAYDRPGELLIRISVDEMNVSENLNPSSMRGRSVVLVLGDAPVLPGSFHYFSQPGAVDSGESDDGLPVDNGDDYPRSES